jgi:hypothetical protein
VNEGSLEVIRDKLLKRKDGLRGKMAQQLKIAHPMSKEKIPPATKLWAVDNLGTMDMQELRQEFGDAAVNLALFNLEKLRNDGRRKK